METGGLRVGMQDFITMIIGEEDTTGGIIILIMEEVIILALRLSPTQNGLLIDVQLV